ncbi:MAG: trimethylamine corrinoid protein 2 [Oscillospiraceae bacterium]|nr:trimethylamine corrinoid protein 2 [Oscillospiraceae bacterium]
MKNPFSKKISDESFELSMRRYDAFFKGEVYDRPPVSITFRKESATNKPEEKTYAAHRERWMDVEQRAKEASWNIDSTEYYADAMPTYFPSLGPEIFSAICGCDYSFAADTAWSFPIINDWETDINKTIMSRYNEYFIAMDKFIRELLKYSKDKFAVGFPDFHAGGDHLAALRNPQNLCTDLIDYPEFVKAKLKSSYADYFKLYEYFYNMITLEGEPTTGWIGLVVNGRYNILQNDFSCMISTKMFEEFFLDGIIDECNRLDHSIYHLDGPDAVKHLDMLLEIKKLDAIQWLYGAGNEGFTRWIPVYQKIQKARKGVFLDCDVNELDDIFAYLKPDGVWFAWIRGITGREHADKVVDRIKNWK